MADSKIEWTDATWNPVTGCDKVSAGCKHCYAEEIAKRFWGDRDFTDVRFHPERLEQPLRWRRPRLVFVNSMSDLFHEDITTEQIAEVFGVMAVAGASDGMTYAQNEPGGAFHGKGDGHKPLGSGMRYPLYGSGPHTFQVLTKRAGRMAELLNSTGFRELVAGAAHRWALDRRDAGYLSDCISVRNNECAPGRAGRMWPLSNVWLGVSVEDQRRADERIPLLLETPAAVRFLSCEPLLEAVDLGIGDPHRDHVSDDVNGYPHPRVCLTCSTDEREVEYFRREPGGNGLAWVIVGGESGNGARQCNVDWIRSIVSECQDAEVPVFVKQLGAKPLETWDDFQIGGTTIPAGECDVQLIDRKGGNPSEWPEDLRVREFPEVRHG